MDPTTDAHLRLLAIFHWVLAALSLLFGAIPVLYAGIGVMMVNGTFDGAGKGPPPAFGWIFVCFGLLGLLLVIGYVTLLALAARALSTRRRWLLVMVAAGLSCAFFPLGTALGIFTIVVLQKPEVKLAFGLPVAPWGPPPAWPAPPQGWSPGPPPGPPAPPAA